ncbi:hypothetical protein ES708_14682 [subsurface metagenome]
MKITIVYDNTILKKNNKGLRSSMGFSCFIQTQDKNLLFDTGWDGDMLVSNMKLLGIDYQDTDIIFISHEHGDHEGGLARYLTLNPNPAVFVPGSFYESLYDRLGPQQAKLRKNIYAVKETLEICPNIYSTGEIEGVFIDGKQEILIKEQSLIINCFKGIIVIVGCSHSGIDKILNLASKFGNVYALIGGFHDFEEYNLLKNISLIVATHCTEHKKEISKLYPSSYVKGGVGYELFLGNN